MVKKIISRSYIALILIFLYAPIFVLALYSFNDSRNPYIWNGFTFKWYQGIFQNEQLMSALVTTISVALLSTLISTVIGTFSAIGIFKMKKNIKALALNVNNIPVLNPDIVTGISLMILFITIGGILGNDSVLGYFTMLGAHVVFSIPYVILSILPKLKSVNEHMFEAALDLGATPWQALYKVIIPVLKPGIISGALIAFTMSIDDFVISYFTTGNGVNNLSIWIYSQTKKGVNPTANAVSTILLLVTTTILLIVNLKDIKFKKGGKVNEKTA